MEIFEQVLSVVFVLALLAGALWFLNRRSAVGVGWRSRKRACLSRLEAIERLPLTAQHSLHLVRAGDRALLVALHGAGCTLLESQPWLEFERGREPSAPAAFREVSR